MSPLGKRILHRSGALLALAGIIVVALRLRDQTAAIDATRFAGIIGWAVAGLAIIHGLTNLWLALVWRSLLEQFGVRPGWRWIIRTYGIAQIAKYLPGNILHLAGRQALGMAVGLPGWPLAQSMVWELGLLALTGALLGILALPLACTAIPALAGPGLLLLALGGVAMALRRMAGAPVSRALWGCAAFLATSGLLFVALIRFVDVNANQEGMSLLPVVGAYVLAWLAGLLTPGAPAGVGVRELVLLALLHSVIDQAGLLLVIVLGRLVTVGGDLAFLGIAVAIGGKSAPAGNACAQRIPPPQRDKV